MVDQGTSRTQPMATSTSSAEVTEEEIRSFKTSLVARRFPGIQSLSREQLASLVLSERKSLGVTRTMPRKMCMKTEFEAYHEVPPHPEPSPKFIPCSPSKAKATIVMPPEQAFVGVYSPYDADHQDYQAYVTADATKRLFRSSFTPTCPSQAKDTIAVDYFLTSPDHTAKHTERQATKERATKNLAAFSEAYTTGRREQAAAKPTSR